MRFVLLAVIVASASTAARAQGDRGHAEAAELAQAVVSMFAAGSEDQVDFEATAGRLPAGFDAATLPAGSVVVGGLAIREQGEGPLLIGFARLAGDPDSLAATYARAFADARTLEPPEVQGTSVRVCASGGDEVNALFARRREGGAYVSVAFEGGGCDRTTAEVELVDEIEVVEVPRDVSARDHEDVIGDGEIIDEPGAPERPPPHLPVVSADSDVVRITNGFDRDWPSGDYRGNHYRVRFGDLTPAQAASRADDAFRANGWTALGAHDVDGGVVSLWSKLDEQGATVVATVTARLADGAAEVSVVATR